MRFGFRALPEVPGAVAESRPVVDVWLEGIDRAPLACLVDSGALKTRFSADLAHAAGIDLSNGLEERVAVGGSLVTAKNARVTLRLATPDESVSWDASVWFCTPWPFPFQLLGLEGFLRQFHVCLSAYNEWVECVPEIG